MKHSITILVFVLHVLSAYTQVQLVKDLVTVPYNQDEKASDIRDLVEMNGVLYFSANTTEAGRELWRSDGTEAGTWMIKDIYPGWKDSDASGFTVYKNRLYFNATSPGFGAELWVSDGTKEGTYLFEDLFRGTGDGYPTVFTVCGNTLYFTANNTVLGNKELWKSDGSPSGTFRVRDINVGDEGSFPTSLVDFKGTLFFVAKTAAHGRELWKSDGTYSGTQLVKDIFPGTTSSFNNFYGPDPDELTVFQNNLFFVGNTAADGKEIWISDGTSIGTFLLKNINLFGLDSSPENLTVVGNKLYFSAETVLEGRELWLTDGTYSGTVMVEDINPGVDDSNPKDLISSGGILYFSAYSAIGGRELWRSLGSSLTTYQVVDLHPGVGSSYARPLAYMGGKTYFSADNGLQGYELYSTTGASHTTSMVREMYLGSGSGISTVTDVTVIQNKLFYRGGTAVSGRELVCSDGTILGTYVVKDIRAQHNGDLERSTFSLIPNGNDVFFVSKIPGIGAELCKSDGTSQGTKVVGDMNAANWDPYYLRDLFSHQNTLFFPGDNGSDGLELWQSTGSVVSTVQVADINPGNSSSRPRLFNSYNGDLYFVGETGCCGYALLKYDGLSISMVKGNTDFYGTQDATFHSHQNIMYFSAGNPNAMKNGLWRSDGTTLGTYEVKGINPGILLGHVRSITTLGNEIYFTVDDGIHGIELWKSDGTTLGTVMVRDIQTGPLGSKPEDLTVMNGNLYFRATTSTNGTELFRYNPTINTLTLVKEIGFSHNSSYPDHLIAYNNTLYFTANDGVHGKEIWKTQGTSNSTQILKDIYPGIEGSGVDEITVAGGYLFFTASDSTHGHELWYSDGSQLGTLLFQDIYPGIKSSSPRALTLAGSQLFMFALDSLAGVEIHSLNIRGISLPVDKLTLTGQYEDASVKLSWETLHERQTDYFQIERSNDKVLFNPIESVEAVGFQDGKQLYSYFDYNPLPGKSYYRLKLFDIDGSFSFSNVIEVVPSQTQSPNWKIASNPIVNNTLSLRGSPVNTHLQLRIYTMNGKLIWNEKVAGTRPQIDISFPPQISSGVYILQIENQFGTVQHRFICE